MAEPSDRSQDAPHRTITKVKASTATICYKAHRLLSRARGRETRARPRRPSHGGRGRGKQSRPSSGTGPCSAQATPAATSCLLPGSEAGPPQTLLPASTVRNQPWCRPARCSMSGWEAADLNILYIHSEQRLVSRSLPLYGHRLKCNIT